MNVQTERKCITMTSRLRNPQAKANRIPSQEELVAFYRAIGIPAVASAAQAQKMATSAPVRQFELPAFLRDAHAVG
jgi:hypothetical protein